MSHSSNLPAVTSQATGGQLGHYESSLELAAGLVRRYGALVAGDAKESIRDLASLLGDHPAPVLAEAFAIVRLTPRARNVPTEADIVDGLLAAYGKLGLPLSPDATRHVALREAVALAAQYPLGPDGRRRFQPTARLGFIDRHLITGGMANEILRELPGARTEHLERGIVAASPRVAPKTSLMDVESGSKYKVESTLKAAIDALRLEVWRQLGAAARPPAEQVAHAGEWASLSHEFISHMQAKFEGRVRIYGDPSTITSWCEQQLRGLHAGCERIDRTEPRAIVERTTTSAFTRRNEQRVATLNPWVDPRALQQAVEAHIEAGLEALIPSQASQQAS